MNYELAKKLKDAGFSQKGSGKILTPVRKEEGQEIKIYTEKSVYDPTLSELIEACGDDFVLLGKRGNDWYAESRVNIGNGSTPERAVAELWLAINTKQL